MTQQEQEPEPLERRPLGLAAYGACRGLLWGAVAAVAYVLAYAAFAGVWSQFTVGGGLGVFVLVTLVGLAIGLAVGVVVGVLLGAFIAPLVGRRAEPRPGRSALRAALLSLVVTLPVTAVLATTDVELALLFGLGPAVFGAGGAALLGRDVARRQRRAEAAALALSPAGSAPA